MAKRVSTDEKLEKIVNFFKSTPEIYSIKDLEKKIPKECGVSSMLVPDLLKKLHDEDLISVEKCGTSNIYWCFPYNKHHFYSCETEKVALSIEVFKEENMKKMEQIEKMKVLKESTPERESLLEEFNTLKRDVLIIEEENKHNAECSVEEYEKFIKEIEDMKESINRITDNIFTIQGHVSSKYGVSRKDFNRNFDVDDEMDYINTS
ncbi:uncharacterized protein VICG_00766 [Vittaforma corneae ATCC 50505]|uniref:Meiotic nuclear division protein 1 n=1 Tax=Vittaforma corneae (strain ATCC 50505) TaxID=993615 RepID=L2GNS0_VITCO|nr:uncharacterized protein VICG_00766 [Vittaforma corneae ATCC 50505]ELA42125.1 hypothetical protein VICG_00766 [Vittaforma corneae ATCC 50505]